MRKLLVGCIAFGLAHPAFADDSAQLLGVWKNDFLDAT
jgi:hypothetical protein